MQADIPSSPAQTTSKLGEAVWTFRQRYSRFFLIAMLALLHLAAIRGVSDPWARALLVAHLGLLMLWQPFLHAEQKITPVQAALIAFASGAVMLWLGWWLLAFWVVVLVGLVGGKVYQQDARWQRTGYLAVLVYLLALLAIVILPEIAPRREITQEIRTLAEYLLPLLLFPIALLPGEPEQAGEAQVMDFFYSIFLMLVVGIVILGSFTFMTLGQTSYLEALSYTLFTIAGGILLIGLAWNPLTGLAGLNVFFSRYLLSIGVPLEKWLYYLAELFQSEVPAERFLSEGVNGLLRLTWVAGATWRTASEFGEAGETTAYAVEFTHRDLSLTVYSRYRPSPALHWHLRLLGQLLGEFYIAKMRERKLLQQGYLEAVHETGARVTHDVKNLLQSLNVLCSVAAVESEGHSPELQALLRRQLPVISSRLTETLRKLERPDVRHDDLVHASEWWKALQRQYKGESVEFEPEEVRPGARIPGTLFDSVADNLLRNALAKRTGHAGMRVKISLSLEPDPRLRVCDTGPAIAAPLTRTLLREPVKSASGFGIGLYQAARQAETWGHALKLSSNQDGAVCFVLRRTKRDVAGDIPYGSTPAEMSRE